MTETSESNATALPRPPEGSITASTADQPWQDSGTPGFLVKPLHDDKASGQTTLLMKVEAGAYYPAHAHDTLEQIYVIEGSFYDEEASYGAGDFVIRAPGAMHSTGSETGAIMFLVYRP